MSFGCKRNLGKSFDDWQVVQTNLREVNLISCFAVYHKSFVEGMVGSCTVDKNASCLDFGLSK